MVSITLSDGLRGGLLRIRDVAKSVPRECCHGCPPVVIPTSRGGFSAAMPAIR